LLIEFPYQLYIDGRHRNGVGRVRVNIDSGQ
jgi:hypothetical protein